MKSLGASLSLGSRVNFKLLIKDLRIMNLLSSKNRFIFLLRGFQFEVLKISTLKMSIFINYCRNFFIITSDEFFS